MARLSAFTSSEASEPTSLPRRLLGTAVKLVHHHPAWCTQSTLGTGLDGKPKDRCRRRIGGQGTHDDRIIRVEPIVLDDDRWSRLARIGRATRDGPDLATPHSSFQAKLRRRTPGPAWREDSSPPPATDDVRPGRRTSTARPEPRFERDEAPPSAIGCDARGPYRGMWIERWLAWRIPQVTCNLAHRR